MSFRICCPNIPCPNGMLYSALFLLQALQATRHENYTNSLLMYTFPQVAIFSPAKLSWIFWFSVTNHSVLGLQSRSGTYWRCISQQGFPSSWWLLLSFSSMWLCQPMMKEWRLLLIDKGAAPVTMCKGSLRRNAN